MKGGVGMIPTREQLIEERRLQNELREIEEELFDDEERARISDEEYFAYLEHESRNYCNAYI